MQKKCVGLLVANYNEDSANQFMVIVQKSILIYGNTLSYLDYREMKTPYVT